MKRLLVAGALVAAAAGLSSPAAAAGPLGYCDGKVDVVCREYPCEPGAPCTIDYCLVWSGNKCVVG